MSIRLHTYCIFLITGFMISCGHSNVKKDSATSGDLTILADESYCPVVKAEAEAFQNLYSNVKITMECGAQDEAIPRFLKGEVGMIVIGRDLNKEELEYIKQKKITTQTNKIGTEALTLLVNDSYPDSTITTDLLKQIFEGKIKTWNQINSRFLEENIQIVVDKSSSGNLAYLRDKFKLAFNDVEIYAAGSNSKVLDYVRQGPGRLGIIGVNWISDEDDPNLRIKLKGIKVLAVGERNANSEEGFYQPVQENLWEQRYPLIRNVYCITRMVKVDASTGFASFILSDPGQRIVLKEGLLPAIMPGREIVVVKE